MNYTALPASGPLSGGVRVPGDKSISHRAVLFAAMSDGSSRLECVLDSEDVRATIRAVRALGAVVEVMSSGTEGLDLIVTGWGALGPTIPATRIDCGNSGTTCRLLMGLIAGWPIRVTLDGDDSLRRRPMNRVIEPLSRMGARFTSKDGRLPVEVRGGGLRAIHYDMPVASAQVATAVLIAGLRASGTTSVSEPALSRDHTSRILPAFGVGVEHRRDVLTTSVRGPAQLYGADIVIPADPSSAAFPAGAAAIVPGSDVTINDVALNPTRLGFVRVLERMGADIESFITHAEAAETVGEIRVRYRERLRATVVTAEEVPSLVDEVPLLAVVATAAEGTTRFEGVAELRVKESDRLEAIIQGLTALGATVRGGEDWIEVDGPSHLRAATLSSLGDHRLAMAWAVAALVADGPVEISDWQAVAVSYPRFAEDLDSLRA